MLLEDVLTQSFNSTAAASPSSFQATLLFWMPFLSSKAVSVERPLLHFSKDGSGSLQDSLLMSPVISCSSRA